MLRHPSVQAPLPHFPALAWDQYSGGVEAAWRATVEQAPRREQALQEALERHPCLLPFAVAYTPAGTPDYGHHGTIHGAVVTQPRLPGTATLRPDFMRITRDSQWVYVTLFELKWAGLRLFRRGARFADTFDAAREQLYGYSTALAQGEWKAFAEAYRLPAYVHWRDVRIRLVLLAGRRTEVYEHSDRRDRRRREEIIVRSLDSLAPDADARDDITVRLAGGQLRAKHIQPTLRYGPGNSQGLAVIRGLPAAIGASQLSPERRAFLLERLPYWQKYDAQPGLPIRPSGYWE